VKKPENFIFGWNFSLFAVQKGENFLASPLPDPEKSGSRLPIPAKNGARVSSRAPFRLASAEERRSSLFAVARRRRRASVPVITELLAAPVCARRDRVRAYGLGSRQSPGAPRSLYIRELKSAKPENILATIFLRVFILWALFSYLCENFQSFFVFKEFFKILNHIVLIYRMKID